MNIITAPDSLLKQRCIATSTLNINVLANMFALMDRHGGVGLAAPQVGIAERFFITSWGEVFIDPIIIPREQEGKVSGVEGCLSLPGESYKVERWAVILVDGKRYEGLAAIVIQHEQNHLDGVLISDIGTRV